MVLNGDSNLLTIILVVMEEIKSQLRIKDFSKVTLFLLLSLVLLGESSRGRQGSYNYPGTANGSAIHAKYERASTQIDPDLLRRGHSHNDYHQENPLDSALQHGLRSVEVDVFPVYGELLVAHTRFELLDARNIDDLYIQPILRLLQKQDRRKKENISKNQRRLAIPHVQNSNRWAYQTLPSRKMQFQSTSQHCRKHQRQDCIIDPSDDSLILLVDFKADPNLSTKLLHKALRPLKSYLTKVKKNGKYHKGRVTVIVSGNQPKDNSLFCNNPMSKKDRNDGDVCRRNPWMPFITTNTSRNSSTLSSTYEETHHNHSHGRRSRSSRQNRERYLFLDGRIKDLYSQRSASIVPLVSFNWKAVQVRQLFGRRWGEDFLREVTDLAHEQGKRIRIWGAPNREDTWRKMIRNNVDWLSVDNHPRWTSFVSGMYAR